MPTPRVANTGTPGPRGPASVRVSGKKLIVTMKSGTREQFEFPTSDLPVKNLPSGEYSVSISKRGDKLWNIHPLSGAVICKTVKFASGRDGAPPMPRQQEGKFGTYLTFTAIHKIVEGPYAGLEFSTLLDYKFFDVGGVTGVGTLGTRAAKLVAYLEAAGFDFDRDEIAYSGNILPELEEIILSRRRRYVVVLRDGWGDSFAPTTQTTSSRSKTGKRKSRA